MKTDEFFTFQILNIEKYDTYLNWNCLSEEEDDGKGTREIPEGEKAADCVVFGTEGEFGCYFMNCNNKSPYFGQVTAVIINIPERIHDWQSFTDFLSGLPEYCKKYPLKKYKEECLEVHCITDLRIPILFNPKLDSFN